MKNCSKCFNTINTSDLIGIISFAIRECLRSLNFKRKKIIPKKILSLRSMAFILFAYLVSFQVKIKVLMHDININLKEHAKIFTMELEFFPYHLHIINTMILRNIKYISYYFYDIRHFIFIHDLSLAKFLNILYFWL